DVRPVEEFAAGHLPRAISVALDGGSVATRAAFVLDPAEPFVVHARSDAEAGEAARLLRAVALFAELGYLAEPAGATATTDTQTVAELARLLDAQPDAQVLDVREPSEYEEAELEGAVQLPYRKLRVAPPALDPERPVYTVCAAGP